MDLSRYLYGPALRYFAAAAEEGSIRAAARKLNVASSAVNRQILTLEKQLGLQLFDRIGRNIRLSSGGEILLAHIRRTLSDLEATGSQLDALQGLRRGVVSVATVESVTESILPDLIARFRADYCGIQLRVKVMSSRDVCDAVVQAQADVGFTFEPPNNDVLNVAFNQPLSVGAILRPDHPLAQAEALTLVQCMEHPIVLPSRHISFRNQLDVAFAQCSITPSTSVEANSLSFMKRLVLRSGMIGFQSPLGLEKELEAEELIFKPLDDPALFGDTFCLITSALRGLALAPAVFYEHSIETLRQAALVNDAILAS